MKKSEMVEIILDVLKEYWCDDGFVTASAILSRIEGTGMLPPYNDDAFQKNTRIFVEPHGNEWEPENE